MKKLGILALSVAMAVGFASAASADTLADVKKRGVVRCGVDGGLAGFSAPDDKGKMQGIDADVCYAVAAAVFGDASKVEFISLTAKERFTALSAGEIDMLSRNTTHTLRRDASLGVDFTYYNYIDGQGFLVKKAIGVKSALELSGATICIQSGTTTERNLAAYFRAKKMDYTPVSYDTSVQTREGFESGACDVLTSDKSQLAAIRSDLKDPESAMVLPETISKEPLGPVVRQGDDAWANIVRWSLFAMINADELGVTSKNVDEIAKTTEEFQIRLMLGLEGDTGKSLGLSKDWAMQIIKQVGSYGESYTRHLVPLGLAREGTLNALWTKGGILYAPPF
ncbi:MAG: amino acid ABC transporter substrate-binding protein [Neomegalonema sp.]|nr:amino acid ABC transporter substrate-binding protein [Neomegalonema sp.]